MPEKYAVVRLDSKIPGGVRIIGSPQADLDYARRLAADRTKAFVMPLAEVYALRTAALSRQQPPRADGEPQGPAAA